MKPRTEATLFQTLIFLNSILLSVGLSRVFMVTNGIRTSLWSVILPVTVTIVLLRLLFTPPMRALISLSTMILVTLVLFLALPAYLVPLRDTVIDLSGKAIYTVQYFSGQAAAVDQLMPFAVTVSASLIGLLVYLTTTRVQLPLLWAGTLLTMMTLNTLRVIKQDTVGIFLAGFAILILMVKRQPFRREGKRRPYRRQSVTAMMVAAPLILFAMAGAVLLSSFLPIRLGRQQQLLEGIADDFSQALGLQPATELQPDFSISFAGFYPLGNRLGGPVSLSDSPVMDINGHNRTMLLRGAIYDRYDGQNWRRDPRGATYRLDNVFEQDLKKVVFDLDQPDPDVLSRAVVSGLIGDSRLTIIPRSSASSMIFTPGRPVSATPRTGDRFQVYFDDHGMLYSKYALSSRNIYDIESRVILTDQRNFSYYANLAFSLGAGKVSREGLYTDDYLAVPDRQIYRENEILETLADRLTEGLDEPYAKALAIRSYLIETATYNLNVAVPPRDEDFVLWFLNTREGYCVYFATAEVMLCRLAGIPARYVEGFILDAPGQVGGTTTVTSDRAHAWCEIYVPFIGWVPVDATPGGLEPDGGGSADPTPDPDVTGTETSMSETSDQPVDPTDPEDPDELDQEAALLGKLLAILLISMAAFTVYLSVRNRIRILRIPEQLRRLYPDPVLRADIYWQELQILFSQDGLRIQNGETPIEFMKRVRERWPGRAGRLDDAGRLISAIRYGRHVPKETEVTMLGNLLAQIEESTYETRAFRHVIHHLILPRFRGVDRRKRLIRGHFWKAVSARLRFVRNHLFVLS